MTLPENLPATLYRFCDENGLKTLVDGTLKMTPPSEFNDPFEIWPGAPRRNEYEGRENKVRRYYLASNGMERLCYFAKNNNSTEREYEKWVGKQIRDKAIYRALEDNGSTIQPRVSGQWGFSCFSALADTEITKEKSLAMWSHYAKDHTGLVIGFDGRHKVFHGFCKNNYLFAVHYAGKRPRVQLQDFENMGADFKKPLMRWAKQKSKVWESEKEWRLISWLYPNTQNEVQRVVQGNKIFYLLRLWGNPQSAAPINKDGNARIVRRVILGARASKDLRASVAAALGQEHLWHVDLYQAELDPHDFKLRLNKIRPGVLPENQ